MKRVLIYRLGSLGDTVVALPSLHLVRRVFPRAERRMLTNFPINAKAAAAEAVLGDSELVQGYFQYPVGARGPLVLLRLWWRLLRWRPQVVVYLAGGRGVEVARRDRRFFQLLGGPRLVGVPVTEEMQANRVLEAGALEPECERLARNLGELGDARVDDPASWDLGLTAEEEAGAAAALRDAGGRALIVFSIGTKLQANDWGGVRWRELMRRLGEMYPEYALAFTGVPGESEASEAVADGWRESAGAESVVINLCGKLTPRESAAVFQRATVYLGHDSGPMHLAAAVGTTCVAIFAARNLPRVWFPHGRKHRVVYHAVECRGCGLETCVVERKRCLTSIGVEEVMAEVRAVLDGESGQGRREDRPGAEAPILRVIQGAQG